MSSRTLVAVAIFATVLIQAGPGQSAVQRAPDASASSASADRGQQVAERNCSQCHAIGDMGDSPNPASPPFRELHRRYPADSLEDAFGKGLLTHHPAMPQLRLAPAEMADLVAYFKAMRSRGETEASAAPSMPRRGAPLIHQK